jgi:hypothetical protein
MFRSIRWRLVASYALITLLTVCLVGVLTLSLVRRDIRKQETNQLTANAQAIARQALPLMQPVVRHAELTELAHTASFFANAQVRILDSQRRILSDSGAMWISSFGSSQQFVYDLKWMMPWLPPARSLWRYRIGTPLSFGAYRTINSAS